MREEKKEGGEFSGGFNSQVVRWSMEFLSRLKDFPFSLVCSRKYAYPNASLWFLVFEESFGIIHLSTRLLFNIGLNIVNFVSGLKDIPF